jgi:hypothetical protein
MAHRTTFAPSRSEPRLAPGGFASRPPLPGEYESRPPAQSTYTPRRPVMSGVDPRTREPEDLYEEERPQYAPPMAAGPSRQGPGAGPDAWRPRTLRQDEPTQLGYQDYEEGGPQESWPVYERPVMMERDRPQYMPSDRPVRAGPPPATQRGGVREDQFTSYGPRQGPGPGPTTTFAPPGEDPAKARDRERKQAYADQLRQVGSFITRG